jgi:hypothetical protein
VKPTVVTPRAPSRLSPAAARMVRGVAETVSDPELRAALERLGGAERKT